MNRPIHRGLVLLASLLGAEPVLAQVPPEPLPAAGEADAGGEPPAGSAPGEIVIVGRRNSDVQRATTQVISVLSAEDIARTGEGDIAGALGRVTGLSVVGDGFVYVRGLGDRYSQALLNGLPLPSPEPLRRAVPLDLFPTDIVTSSLVQKTYSPNFPGEFGGGVIDLTTLAIPRMPFLSLSLGASGDTATTGRFGYDHYGGGSDWTGYDDGTRGTPPALAAFLASGRRLSAGSVDSGAIARELVTAHNSLVQSVGEIPANWSSSVSGGSSWMLGDSQLGLIAAAGYANKWRTRDNLEQSPASADLSVIDKDYHSVATENRIVANALLGLAYEFGDRNTLRWTSLYVHDTLKRTSLAEGRQNSQKPGWDFREQSTGWYERQLAGTQLAAGLKFDPVSLNVRAGYSRSRREAPFELGFGYSRSNIEASPCGAYFINRLDNGQTGYAKAAFSYLGEGLFAGGVDATWRITSALALTAGYDHSSTERESTRREFQILAPSTFPAGVALLRPDYLVGPEVVDQFGVSLVETTESDPAFGARLRTHAGFVQLQAGLDGMLELSAGARYETADQEVRPMRVFDTLTNSGAFTRLSNDYLLPAATLAWRLRDDMQVRLHGSKTVARPQFRELMFQTYFDPETNREYRGNPLLTDSRFLNAEARFEWYFSPGERFSVAGFYKKIVRPIEAYTGFNDNTPVTSFANAPEARLHGFELEVQKHFPLALLSSRDFLVSRRAVVSGNYTFTDSRISVGAGDIVQVFGSTMTTRPARDYFLDGSPLAGQSDHLANLQLGLESMAGLSQQTLLISYASERVTSRGAGGLPDIREHPGVRLDLVVRQGLEVRGQAVELKLEARNLLGRDYREFQQRGANRVYYNRYELGTTFAMSVTMQF